MYSTQCTKTENIFTETCLYQATAVRKHFNDLLEAVNRIVPFLYIYDMKYVKETESDVSFKRSAWNQMGTQKTLNLETISGLVLLLIFGHLCGYLALVGEKIV